MPTKKSLLDVAVPVSHTQSPSSSQLPFINPSFKSSSLSFSPSPLFVTAYSPKRIVSLSFVGEGRTKQSHRDECDINQIMARYQRTGVLEHVREHPPQHGDVTAIDFQTSMDLVVQARQQFEALPSSIRDYCGNDPAAYLDLVTRPEYAEEARRLGLLRPAADPATPPASRPAEAPQAPLPGSEGASLTPPKGGQTNSTT